MYFDASVDAVDVLIFNMTKMKVCEAIIISAWQSYYNMYIADTL